MELRTPDSGAPRPGLPRKRVLAALAAPAVLLAAGCGDLPLASGSAEGTPSRVEILHSAEPMLAGESAPLRFRVLDEHGVPITNLPPWVTPAWTTDGPLVVREGHFEAVGSGTAALRLTLSGMTALANVRINPRELRVTVPGAYVTQGIQRFDGSIPLVAGRPGHLRVFVTGDQANFFRPRVRAHFYLDGQAVHTVTTQASDEGVPVEVAEGELGRSWNLPVPGSLIRPGAAYRVEVLVEGGLPAGPASVPRFPASGQPRAMEVREVPPLRITFVPIDVVGSARGNVHPGNVSRFMERAEEVWPLHQTDVMVREAYSTSTRANTDQGWSELLREIRTLRIADGSQRYYHGIVRREAGPGGIGYVGLPVAVSYDGLPGASWTVAHELGHNFGRLHAPCGSPSGVDPSYPYSDGGIGQYGLTPDGGTVHPPETPDLMSYCGPRWVSDYNYGAVLAFRSAQADRAPEGGGPASSGGPPGGQALLVSGTVGPGGARLDPAFTLPVAPVTPEEPGPWRLEGLDARGAVLFSVSFAGEALGETGPAGPRHFAYALPLGEDVAGRLARLRLSGAGQLVERASTVGPTARAGLQGAPGPELGVSVERPAPGLASLRWDAARFPLLLVRDAADGRVLARLRGGEATLRTDAAELELHLSDGVASLGRRAPVSPR